MSKVFVLDTTKRPLNPVHPGRARLLLKAGKAAIYRRYPFTILLKAARDAPTVHPLRLKIDPGAKTTGLALVNDATGEVVWAAELTHRGAKIKKRMEDRRGCGARGELATRATAKLGSRIAGGEQAWHQADVWHR